MEDTNTVTDGELTIPTDMQNKVLEWANAFIKNPQANDTIISDINKYATEVLNSKDIVKDAQNLITKVIQEKKKILSSQVEEAKKELKDLDKQEKEALKEVEKQQEKIEIDKEKSQTQIKTVGILDIFSPEEYTETSSAYKMICPDCGLQGGRTEGFILFPDTDTAFCHSSGKHFRLLEAYALKKGIIKCLDGRDKDDEKRKVLGGELYTLTLDEFRNEFSTDIYNSLIDKLKIKKRIELIGNDRLASNFSDDMGDIYKSRNVLFFRGESRDIVEIGRYKKVNHEGKQYIEIGFIPITGNRLITLAEMFVEPWTTIIGLTGKAKTVKKSMSHSMASICIESPNFQNKLPIISRIFDIQIPIIYKKTLTFPKKGYDERFGSWLPYNAPEIKTDLCSLEEAKIIIDKIFEEFCFADEEDRTHAIAGFITPFLRGLFPKFSTRTPVFIYMANRERAGKDYCAGCSGMVYEGANTEEPAMSNDEKGYSNANEEIRKKIMACMIQGKKRFHSANNKGLLNNSIFEGVTTAEIWSDRILGRSHIVTFSNEMDYSLSGNMGIKLTPDLANRGRIVNLHLADEDANARQFKNPKLHEWILDNRSMVISALYKLVENWVQKGMPKGSVPFTSFPIWSEICGGIMEASGYDNPCKKGKDAVISLDSETEEMKQLFEICHKKKPNIWLDKKEIWELVASEEIFSDINSITNVGEKVKFGLKIDKFGNRILSDILMKVNNTQARADRRKYKFVDKDFVKTAKTVKNDENLTQNNTQMVGLVGFGRDCYTGETFRGTENNTDTLKIQGIQESIPNPTNPTISTKNENGMLDNFETLGTQEVGSVGGVSGIEKKPVFGILENEKKCDTVVTNQVVTLATPVVVSQTQSLELTDFSKKFKDYIKKEEVKETHTKEPKEKTDRELQFYESPETVNIIEQCTEEQVFEWIKTNPQNTYETLYVGLGNGIFKHIQSLGEKNMIKENEVEGWEVVDNGINVQE